MSDFKEKVKRDPSVKYMLKQHGLEEHLIFITYDGRVEGVIEEILTYELKLKGRDELLKKHDILYLYKPEASKTLGRVLRSDEKVAGRKLGPAIKISERLKMPLKPLHLNMYAKNEVEVTLRNGHIIRGRIHSFGIFSTRIEMDRDSRVVIMKPSIYKFNFDPEPAPAEAFRGNVKTRVFHSSGCRYFNGKDCTKGFASREEAIGEGFRPHKQCDRQP